MAYARPVESGSSGRIRQSPFLLRVIGLLFTSLIFSILIEWFCIAFVADIQGSEHSELLLEREIGFLNADFRENISGSSVAVMIMTYTSSAYYYLFQWTYLEGIFMTVGDSIGVSDYVLAMKFITLLFLVRVGILIFSLPIFILFAIAGITSGFAMRDIRRWSGGREYGGVYHSTKRLAPKAVILTWFVYLASPVSLHPNLIILPCAIFFGLNILVLCASFKKYL